MTIIKVIQNKALHPYSTFGIGGPSSYFISVSTIDQMQEAMLFAKEKQLVFTVIGKGSNILFDTRGYRGIVIHNKINFFAKKDDTFQVGAGFSLPSFAKKLARCNCTGCEFAIGIPATIGGAIYMNAAAYNRSISDNLISVDYMHADGQVEKFYKEQLQFDYRFSTFQKMQGAILQAAFSYLPDIDVADRMNVSWRKRQQQQPLEEKSIGCIFRNPSKEQAAAKLIEDCGLKGYAIGDAMISSKHANFIINKNKASSENVKNLIQYIKDVVLREKNILLREEIQYLPY